MIDELMGLPAHPLIVHAAVIFGPLLIAAVLTYALVPPVRKTIWWAVAGLGVAGPIALWLAKLSGDSFRERQMRNGVQGELLNKINEHANFGQMAAWYGTALGVLALAMVYLISTAARRPISSSSQIVNYALIVASLVLAGLTAYYLFKVGHSGATMVWENS